MEQEQTALIAEQLGRLADRIEARLKALEVAQGSHEILETERANNQKDQIGDLKSMVADHETRLRGVQEQTTRNQVVLGLSSGGAVIASLAAAVKAFFIP